MSETNPQPGNQLLDALPAKEYKRLLPDLEPFKIIFADIIYEPATVIKHAYFPLSGIVSLLTPIENNSRLEVGIVGNEGIIGLPVALGVKTSHNFAIVQGTGDTLRIKTADLLKQLKKGGELPRLLLLYTHSLMTQISQASACLRFHNIEPRLARWLLMTHDRMKSDEFRLTQKFLSDMLGVQREAVSRAAGKLQHQKLIRYSRGVINILNRKKLETVSCKCYETIKAEYKGFVD